MGVASFSELTSLRASVQTANLVADAKHTALWCLDQLPKLYADFCQNHDARFSERILRLAQGLMKRLAEKETGVDAGRMSDAIVGHLGDLHERLGLAPLP